MNFLSESPHNLCLFALHFNESSLRTQGPIRRGLSFWRWRRGLFSLLRPGVMGPCVRRDDPLKACVRPRPHQRAAQFSHMRFPCLARGTLPVQFLVMPKDAVLVAGAAAVADGAGLDG